MNYDSRLLEQTMGNIILELTIFIVGILLIIKSGIPILMMGCNWIVLAIIIFLVAIFKGYFDEKNKTNLKYSLKV